MQTANCKVFNIFLCSTAIISHYQIGDNRTHHSILVVKRYKFTILRCHCVAFYKYVYRYLLKVYSYGFQYDNMRNFTIRVRYILLFISITSITSTSYESIEYRQVPIIDSQQLCFILYMYISILYNVSNVYVYHSLYN